MDDLVINEPQKFDFKCEDCHFIFYAELDKNCPNCGSSDVRIISKFKILKLFCDND